MSDDNQPDKSDDFYASKGLIRHMIILPKEEKELLKKLAKLHRLTQGEIVEVLLSQDMNELAPKFQARADSKRQDRPAAKKVELSKQLKDATPEQLAAIQAILANSTQAPQE